eukprot:CAMPEP_0174272970 /NCGR_PEP_ID=MMETSP0439-20130205/52895_1 /TAXON_ID=0 /ORGANISM="Stereomyxa ramosa, Strain Chinc5" /LENGTH=868 /DNA_ID=CAMNT_0015363813 /DNA_START=37 /DNA_END=2640 /DNA_ORIENTATION=+
MRRARRARSLSVGRQNTLDMLFGSKDQPKTQAFYNTIGNLGILIVLSTLYSLYFVFEQFFAPLFWAVVVGVALHPIKRKLIEFHEEWLKWLAEYKVPLILGILLIPFSLPRIIVGFLFSRYQRLIFVSILLVILFTLDTLQRVTLDYFPYLGWFVYKCIEKGDQLVFLLFSLTEHARKYEIMTPLILGYFVTCAYLIRYKHNPVLLSVINYLFWFFMFFSFAPVMMEICGVVTLGILSFGFLCFVLTGMFYPQPEPKYSSASVTRKPRLTATQAIETLRAKREQLFTGETDDNCNTNGIRRRNINRSNSCDQDKNIYSHRHYENNTNSNTNNNKNNNSENDTDFKNNTTKDKTKTNIDDVTNNTQNSAESNDLNKATKSKRRKHRRRNVTYDKRDVKELGAGVSDLADHLGEVNNSNRDTDGDFGAEIEKRNNDQNINAHDIKVSDIDSNINDNDQSSGFFMNEKECAGGESDDGDNTAEYGEDVDKGFDDELQNGMVRENDCADGDTGANDEKFCPGEKDAEQTRTTNRDSVSWKEGGGAGSRGIKTTGKGKNRKKKKKKRKLRESTEVCVMLFIACFFLRFVEPCLYIVSFSAAFVGLQYCANKVVDKFSLRERLAKHVTTLLGYLVPAPVRYLTNYYLEGDNRLKETICYQLDMLMTLLIILGVVFGTSFIVVFFGIQLKYETEQFVVTINSLVQQLLGEVEKMLSDNSIFDIQNNEWVVQGLTWIEEQGKGWLEQQTNQYFGSDFNFTELEEKFHAIWGKTMGSDEYLNTTFLFNGTTWDQKNQSLNITLVAARPMITDEGHSKQVDFEDDYDNMDMLSGLYDQVKNSIDIGVVGQMKENVEYVFVVVNTIASQIKANIQLIIW